MIWVPSEIDAWEIAQVIQSDAKSTTVKLKNGKDIKLPGNITKYDSITEQSLEENVDNLVELENYSEGIILHHIKRRFQMNTIYALVSNILIAMNPYQRFEKLYTQTVIDEVFERTKEFGKVIPHVYSIGAAAVFNMNSDGKDQAILISGESGAGKTEATKKVLQYISTICGSTSSRSGARTVEYQILDSNPLLESFGNAKTVRNNNSSRFGKYMEVNFDTKYKIKGCNIIPYLLEKSRVVRQGPTERNYHIFYMLLMGASKDMKRDFSLKPADQFYYLAQSGCLQVDRRQEDTEFNEMLSAMDNLNMDPSVQYQIFQCLAGILHIGNLTIVAANRDGQDAGSRVASPADCRRVATLFGLNPDGLEKALCVRESIVNNEPLISVLSPSKAMDQRDNLAKHVYEKVFTYIVSKVNSSLFRGKNGPNIGVLDIFGFEVFKLNSFEQLCINYCNERLQTFFNEIIFEGEMKSYIAEGLPCEDISYQNNTGCVRLIDFRGAGIFAYLDSESVVPKGSDEKFVSKLNQIFDENLTTKSIYFARIRRSPFEFAIRHFAGDVAYDATDFLEKNRDSLADNLISLLQQSTLSFLQLDSSSAVSGSSASPEKGGHSTRDTSPGHTATPSNNKKGSKLTLSAKFKLDLDQLMYTLRGTIPHFIRCIKPNNDQLPNQFDPKLVLNQLKYSGLFEAIRIRKSGYAVRIPHEQFIRRYKICIPDGMKISNELKVNRIGFCQFLLELLEPLVHSNMESLQNLMKKPNAKEVKSSAVDPVTPGLKSWIIGNSKVFIRTQQFKYQLDSIREKSTSGAVIPIQKLYREYKIRCKLSDLMGDNQKGIEMQRKKESSERLLMMKEDQLSMDIEIIFRGDVELQKRIAETRAERIREERKRQQIRRDKAAMFIQKIIRGWLGKKKGCIHICEKMLEKAMKRRDEVLIRKAICLPKLMGVTSKLIRMYLRHAKPLILEVMHEAYVSNQLDEAIMIGSVECLQEAIQLTEIHHMPYLPNLRIAKSKLQKVLMLRSFLSRIKEVLSKCVSIPSLVKEYDHLDQLVKRASTLGLAGESLVQEAALRISKIQNLIALRNKIRLAVEICSPNKMQSAMMERAKHVQLYGEDLFADECKAVMGISQMLYCQLNLQSEEELFHMSQDAAVSTASASVGMSNDLDIEVKKSEKMREFEGITSSEFNQIIDEDKERRKSKKMSVSFDKVEDDQEMMMKEQEEKKKEGKGVKEAVKEGVDEVDDIYLPVYVRKVLENMKNSVSISEFESNLYQLFRLVPDEIRRKFYVRVFKWVLCYATWKYRLSYDVVEDFDESSNHVMLSIHSKMNSPEQQHDRVHRPNSKGYVPSLLKDTHSFKAKSSPKFLKSSSRALASPKRGYSKKATVKSLHTDVSTLKKPIKMTKITKDSVATSPLKLEDVSHLSSEDSQLLMKAFSPLPRVKNSFSPSKYRKEIIKTPLSELVQSQKVSTPRLKWLPEQKFDLLEVADRYSTSSNQYPGSSDSPNRLSNHVSHDERQSPKKQSSSPGPYLSSPVDHSDGLHLESTYPTNHIPFSQRQAKSTVAAHEILKKAKKFQKETKSDKLIQETVSEYDSFISKLSHKSHWA